MFSRQLNTPLEGAPKDGVPTRYGPGTVNAGGSIRSVSVGTRLATGTALCVAHAAPDPTNPREGQDHGPVGAASSSGLGLLEVGDCASPL